MSLPVKLSNTYFPDVGVVQVILHSRPLAVRIAATLDSAVTVNALL